MLRLGDGGVVTAAGLRGGATAPPAVVGDTRVAASGNALIDLVPETW